MHINFSFPYIICMENGHVAKGCFNDMHDTTVYVDYIVEVDIVGLRAVHV